MASGVPELEEGSGRGTGRLPGGRNSQGTEKLKETCCCSGVDVEAESVVSTTDTIGRRLVETHLNVGTGGLPPNLETTAPALEGVDDPFPGVAVAFSSNAFFRRVPADCFFRSRLIVSI